MLNNQFRTSLTRDEIIGILLGWIKGPDILVFPEEMEIGPNEQEALELHAYSVHEDLKERKETAWELYAECLERGEKREECRKFIEGFHIEDEEFKLICDQFDDEISKGENSMLRIDQRYTTNIFTFYTRVSVEEWTRTLTKQNSIEPSPLIGPRIQTKMAMQGEAILACLAELGYNPKKLPPTDVGKDGIRKQVKTKLQTNELFKAPSSFRNAWGHLLEEKRISSNEG